jgi:hypothetical protein
LAAKQALRKSKNVPAQAMYLLDGWVVFDAEAEMILI